MDATAIPGAVCGQHADQPVTFACRRCGSFACEACRAATGGELCLGCFVREGGRPLTADALIREGFSLAFERFSTILPFTLLHFVPGLAIALYSSLVIGPRSQKLAMQFAQHADFENLLHLYAQMFAPIGLMSLLSMVTSSLGMACFIQVFADGITGQRRSGSELFSAGLRAFPATLGVVLVQGIGAGIGTVLCCAPGVWLYTMLGLGLPAVGLGGRGFGAALGESWDLVRPRFWLVLGVTALGWAVVFGGSMASGVLSGVLKLAGTPGQVMAAVFAAAVGALVPLPLYALMTACYARCKAHDAARMAGA